MNDLKQPQRIEILLKAYGNQTASPREIRELFQLLGKTGGEEKLKTAVFETLYHETASGDGEVNAGSEGSDRRWAGLQHVIRLRRRRRMVVIGLAAAAVLLLLIGTVEFSPLTSNSGGRLKAELAIRGSHRKTDIAPGTSKAVLTLAGGKKIWLDSVRNGSLAQQGNAEIFKPAAGQLVYNTGDREADGRLYNSVETPRGGQYRVRLPDGTEVWLNASSTLRFPTCFTGPDRRVELTGEAYFEVAKNASRPFHVLIGKTDIKVLGTHFNVMGYANEKHSRTTLLEGEVDITASGRTKKLLPGKEAVVSEDDNSLVVAPGNTEQAVAWKNGFFRFHETSIRAIMRQLERWYDVDVEFRTEASDQDYTGVVSRNEHLSVVLQTLELTGTVHFGIVGRKVIVLP